MMSVQHIIQGVLVAGDLKVVIGNNFFLQSFVFPVITVQGAVEHVRIIDRAKVTGRRNRRVISQARRPADLTSTETPGLTRLFYLVQGFMDENAATSVLGGRDHCRQVVVDDVVES